MVAVHVRVGATASAHEHCRPIQAHYDVYSVRQPLPGCSRTAWGQAARLMGGMQVMVAGCMASKLRPHQWEGVRFLWDNIVSQYEVHT